MTPIDYSIKHCNIQPLVLSASSNKTKLTTIMFENPAGKKCCYCQSEPLAPNPLSPIEKLFLEHDFL